MVTNRFIELACLMKRFIKWPNQRDEDDDDYHHRDGNRHHLMMVSFCITSQLRELKTKAIDLI